MILVSITGLSGQSNTWTWVSAVLNKHTNKTKQTRNGSIWVEVFFQSGLWRYVECHGDMTTLDILTPKQPYVLHLVLRDRAHKTWIHTYEIVLFYLLSTADVQTVATGRHCPITKPVDCRRGKVLCVCAIYSAYLWQSYFNSTKKTWVMFASFSTPLVCLVIKRFILSRRLYVKTHFNRNEK